MGASDLIDAVIVGGKYKETRDEAFSLKHSHSFCAFVAGSSRLISNESVPSIGVIKVDVLGILSPITSPVLLAGISIRWSE